MKKLLILTLLLNVKSLFSCEIQGPDKIYLTGNSSSETIEKAFKFSNCTSEITKDFVRMITNVKGTIHQSQFSSLLGTNNIDVKNNTLRIYDLSSYVSQKLNLGENQTIADISFLNGENTIFAYRDQELSAIVKSPIKAGENTIALELSSPFSSPKQEWAKVNILYKVMALTAKEHLQAHKGALTPSQFKWEYIETKTPEKFHTNQDALIFYTLTRPLRIGENLESSMLTPISIVQSGVPAKVEYANSKVVLSGHAVPMRGGKIGEIIQLRNTKTNKIISGKVVDFNKVVIEL